jgi:hypothetical protein
MTDPAPAIRHEVQELIQLQIDTLKLESSLTPSQLWEYHSRSQRINALYRELDQIGRERLDSELRTASKSRRLLNLEVHWSLCLKVENFQNNWCSSYKGWTTP